MRIIFMGTPEFAVTTLRSIVDARYEIPLVVSAPDKPKGRGQRVAQSAVKEFALSVGLEVATPGSLKEPEFVELVKSIAPDVICVVAFRILPEVIYSIPSMGCFNLHASLLPKYRGAAPINWAIINGERETGVTTFYLERKVDVGEMIMQRSIPIGPEMTAGELHDELMVVGADVVMQTLALIEQAKAVGQTQDGALASAAPKIFRDDCRIDWNRPAERVHDFIRGLSPHPTAFSQYEGMTIKIYRASCAADGTLPPGRVSVLDGELYVGTGTQALRIEEIQQEGRRSMRVEEFLRGFTFSEGATLG